MNINKKTIIEIISKHAKVPVKNLNADASTDNIETWDSLAQLRIILELIEKTKIKIPSSNFGQYNSIKKIEEKFLK